MPDTHDNITQSDIPDRLHDEVGQFFYYEGTFEAAVNAAKAGVGITPFSTVKIGGDYDWETNAHQTDKEEWGKDTVRLQKKVWTSDDGRIYLKVKAGWQVAMLMFTDNNDYFMDNVEGDFVNYTRHLTSGTLGDKLELLEGEPADTVAINDNQFSASEAVFVMNGDTGDYLSVDIDNNSKTIGQMRVRLDGTQMFQNTDTNNEVELRMIWARVWDGDYPSIDELSTNGENNTASPPISENDDLEEEEEKGGSGDTDEPADEPADEPIVPLTPEYGLLYLFAGIVVVGLMVKYTRGA